ncbi:MAG: LCP family protein [Ardenticatenia bacterium]|nr:LCP family protein [Ardenticatenia bacterium]
MNHEWRSHLDVEELPAPTPSTSRRTGCGPGGCRGGCSRDRPVSVRALVVVVVGIIGAAFMWAYWRAIVLRGPVHVLILGTDERPGEAGPFRSDTMILARFSPRGPRVALLSIPRDLWVAIPGVGENRINAAHFFGGPLLAKETVATLFEVPVHYYVKVDFDGFVRIVDAMGGIEVDVPEPLVDSKYPTPDYGVTTVRIDAGFQQMDGDVALIYARSRYSTSDFDRARRQQQILAAMKAKLQQPGTWLRVPRIARAVVESVETDMPLQEWPVLAMIVWRAGEVERYAIGPNEVTPTITANGADVLLPDWEAIRRVLAQVVEE